jgi:hypothetical protein
VKSRARRALPSLLCGTWGVALTSLLACGTLFASPSRARACAACASGDPTLTVMGTEQPYAGRLRLAVRGRVRGDRLDDVKVLEGRTDLSLAWSPWPTLSLSADLPVVARAVSVGGAPRRHSVALGDAEARVRWFVFRDRELAPRHLVALVGGVAAPTGESSAAGVALPRDALAGTGVWSPLLGVSYAYFAHPLAFFASVVGYLRLGTMDGEAPGESLRGTVAVQHQLVPALALRVAADARVDARVRRFDGQRERGTGGGIVFAGVDAVVSLGGDLVLFAGLRVPVVQALEGGHVETALGELGLAADL